MKLKKRYALIFVLGIIFSATSLADDQSQAPMTNWDKIKFATATGVVTAISGLETTVGGVLTIGGVLTVDPPIAVIGSLMTAHGTGNLLQSWDNIENFMNGKRPKAYTQSGKLTNQLTDNSYVIGVVDVADQAVAIVPTAIAGLSRSFERSYEMIRYGHVIDRDPLSALGAQLNRQRIAREAEAVAKSARGAIDAR